MEFELGLSADVLSLKIGETEKKVVLPRGERGPPGRDGLSMKGDKGDKGDAGRDGRDSIVPGPQGEKGEQGADGPRGVAAELYIGEIRTSRPDEPPAVLMGGTPDKRSISFILPRGDMGIQGPPGRNGKDGTHEFIDLHYVGTNPNFQKEWNAKYIIADGLLTLPELTGDDLGKWFHVKTFSELLVCGCIENTNEGLKLEKESAKFVVIQHNQSFRFTRF
jgi:hypothetical protein